MNLADRKKFVSQKDGRGLWYCISISVDSINSVVKFKKLGFKEPKYQPPLGCGYNLYFATLDWQEYRQMLEKFRKSGLAYHSVSTTEYGTDEYASYLAGDFAGDPRD